jgi:hypothetical protein
LLTCAFVGSINVDEECLTGWRGEVVPEENYSFVFDRRVAGQVFKDVGTREIVIAILAAAAPKADWNGCVVYEGESPLSQVETACIGTRGRSADEVQQWLVERLEEFGIPVLQLYEGGPEITQVLARASGGTWSVE